MVSDITIMYDRWLRHPEYGVAAMLPTIPRVVPALGATPATVISEPTMPTIYNDVEHESVVREIDPDKEPALVVFTDSDPDVPMHPNRRAVDRTVTTTIAYTTREMPPLRAVQWGGLILRAVKLSVGHFNDQRKAKGYRELNGVSIQAVRSVTEQRVSGAVGRSRLWGFLLVDSTVLDTIL